MSLVDEVTTSRDTARGTAAHRIAGDGEAIEVARKLAPRLALRAAERDRDRKLPYEEVDWFSQAGLWAITVPKRYGGAGVSFVTLNEVMKIIAAADPSLGQLPQNHFMWLDLIGLSGSEEQKRFFYREVLSGKRFGNACSERGGRTPLDFKTRVSRDGSDYVIEGKKFYGTGALFGDYVLVMAIGDDDRLWLGCVPKGTPGLTVIDDWTGFGQRTTASGTVVLEAVRIPPSHLFPASEVFERPTLNGPFSQVMQAAIDSGIAHAALADTIKFVRERSRPWIDSKVERACDDPLTIREIGRLEIQLRAADLMLERAGRTLDDVVAKPEISEDDVASASVAVAEAKVLTTEIALLASEKLFELSGTASTLGELNLDRHWRNARTHTLHDPVRWKYHLVGNYYLNGVNPARHPWN